MVSPPVSAAANTTAAAAAAASKNSTDPAIAPSSDTYAVVQPPSIERATSTFSNAPSMSQKGGNTTTTAPKYLCAAPRPEQWDECADRVLPALLDSLSSSSSPSKKNKKKKSSDNKNKKKRVKRRIGGAGGGSEPMYKNEPSRRYKVVKRTIKRVRERHNIQPRVGRGRKSNAEHCLKFYEYLLERIKEEDGVSSEDDDDDEEEEDFEDEEEEYCREETAKVEEEKDDTAGNKKEASNSRIKKETTGISKKNINIRERRATAAASASITRQERDGTPICNVCDEPGGVIACVCTTCPRVFHGVCVRPPITTAETRDEGEGGTVDNDNKEGGNEKESASSPTRSKSKAGAPVRDWRCAYCVLSTEPKHTKPRRVAAAAVRLMARLKNQHKRNKKVTGVGRGGETRSSIGGVPEQQELQHRATTADDGKMGNDEDVWSNKNVKDDESKQKPDSDGSVKSATNVDQPEREKDDSKIASATPTTPTRKKESPEAQQQRGEDENDKKEKAEKSDAGAVASPSPSSSSPTKKRELDDLNKYMESISPNFRVEDGGRGKRSRRKSTFYDPQTVPAGQWLSDEFPDPQHEKEEAMEEGAKPKVTETDGKAKNATAVMSPPRRTHHHHRGDGSSTWCNFCNDDPSIRICCFCACRVCFGKQRQTQLLLCDMCDDEYHTFCLDPPLTKLPPLDQKWYCPTCMEAQERRVARTSSRTRGTSLLGSTSNSAVTEEAPTTYVRRSSRPPAVKTVETPSPPPPPPEKTKARPRGRPRKTSTTPPTITTANSSGKKRKGPGRPPKSASSTSPASSGPPRKRGRPPKLSSSSSSKGDKKRSASAFKEAMVANHPNLPAEASDSGASGTFEGSTGRFNALPAFAVQTMPPQEMPLPVKVSRSGRTVKRSSFHDEIEEREQHLRSGRYPEMQYKGAADTMPYFRQPETASGDASTSGAAAVPLGGVSVAATSKLAFAYNRQITTAAAAGVDAHLKPPVVYSQVPFVTNAQTTAAAPGVATAPYSFSQSASAKTPRRKPGARECMQLSRRLGANIVADNNMEILLDYCQRGKVEHLVRMRERLDEHARFLSMQLAGLEALVKEKGKSDVKVPPLPPSADEPKHQ